MDWIAEVLVLNLPRLCVKSSELLFQRHKRVAAWSAPAYVLLLGVTTGRLSGRRQLFWGIDLVCCP